ncbi:tetratricopeptide repeat protein [Flagellimonas sp. S174]|uniref:tetratricopeptide repeat protein n=1 Tax=Flagellimonas sp. S174 TaxID=3410790 RepID=UPI003BF5D657
MKTCTWKTFFLFLFFGPIVLAQENPRLDSLLKAYKTQKQDSLKVNTAHAIYDYYYESNPNLALKYSLEGLKIAQRIKYRSGTAKSFDHKGKALMIARKLDSANIYFKKSLKIYDSLNNRRAAGLVAYNMIQALYLTPNYDGALDAIELNRAKYATSPVDSLVELKLYLISAKVYMRKASYKKGFEVAFKALAIAEKLYLEDEVVKIKATLASLYHYTNNKEKSIEIKKELLELYKGQNNLRKIGLTLNDLGNSNYVIENYDIALAYLEESLTYSQKVENQGLIGITLFNIGKTYVRLGETQKGIDYLKKAVQHSRYVSHHALSESWALKRLGDVYTEELNRPEKALPYLNRAIALADSVGNKDDLYQSYRDRSQAYAALGNYKKALQDHEIYKAINDSVYSIEKSRTIERLKTEFETKEKEQKIALQDKEITVLEQKASISNLQKLILGIGLLLCFIGFYAIRQKMKRNRLEKERVDAELAFKKKELTTHALHLAKKNEVLEGLKQKAEELKENEESKKGYQQLIRTINFDLQDDNNWENFARYFEEVHKDFNSNVKSKYPQVTSNELRLLALLKMNLSSKEIASILNISPEGIKKARYRLRKKLDITTEDSLQDLVLSL